MGQNRSDVPTRNAGITPFFANRKMLIADTERRSASSYAFNAFLEAPIRSANVPLSPDSDSAGTKREHGAVHHRPLVSLSKRDFEFRRGLRMLLELLFQTAFAISVPKAAYSSSPCRTKTRLRRLPRPGSQPPAWRSTAKRIPSRAMLLPSGDKCSLIRGVPSSLCTRSAGQALYLRNNWRRATVTEGSHSHSVRRSESYVVGLTRIPDRTVSKELGNTLQSVRSIVFGGQFLSP